MAAWPTCLKDNNMKPRLVIIGAGLAGVSLALRCRDAMQVTLIENLAVLQAGCPRGGSIIRCLTTARSISPFVMNGLPCSRHI